MTLILQSLRNRKQRKGGRNEGRRERERESDRRREGGAGRERGWSRKTEIIEGGQRKKENGETWKRQHMEEAQERKREV